MFDAVIMAGGSGTDPFALQEGVPNKAFISLAGKPLLAYVVESLSRASSIDEVVVVGPADGLRAMHEEGFCFTAIAEKGSMLENAAAGLESVRRDRLCLVATGDIPLLTPESVEAFLSLCRPYDADFYYPILSRESCEKRFPDTRRTYVRLGDGTFTGGNLALISPSWFKENRGRLDIFVSTRKKPLKLLKILPFSILVKFMLGRLTVADLERCLSQLLDVKARAVPCDLVELGIDVDKPGDLHVVRSAIAERGNLR